MWFLIVFNFISDRTEFNDVYTWCLVSTIFSFPFALPAIVRVTAIDNLIINNVRHRTSPWIKILIITTTPLHYVDTNLHLIVKIVYVFFCDSIWYFSYTNIYARICTLLDLVLSCFSALIPLSVGWFLFRDIIMESRCCSCISTFQTNIQQYMLMQNN